jgi:hypothetical protein
MPSLQDIDKFKDVLNALGDEPDVLAERGEDLEDVPEPEEGLPPDLSELLGDMEAPGDEEPSFEGLPEIDLGEEFPEIGAEPEPAAEAPAGEAEPPEAAPTEAFADEQEAPFGEESDDEFVFPDEFTFDDEAEAEQPEPTAEEPTPAPTESEDLDVDDLSALLGDAMEDTEPAQEFAEADEAEAQADEEPPQPPEPGLEGGADAEPEADEFELPEEFGLEGLEGLDDTEELTDDLGGEAEPPEEAPELPAAFEEPDEAPPEAGEEDEFGIPAELLGPQEETAEDEFDLDEFSLPEEFGEEEAAAAPAEPAEEELGAAEPAADEFGLPDEFDIAEEDLTAGAEEPGEGEDEFAIPDEFTFDDEAPASGVEAEEDLESLAPAEGEGKEEEFVIDEFNLGELGEQFGISDDEVLSEEEAEAPAAPVGEELPQAEVSLDLSDADFANLQRTMGQLPRNLKIAIEELIGEKGLGGRQVIDLTKMLVAGESPQALATAVSRITGKRIQIPRGYEKRTGAEFEEETKTLGYLFRRRVWPVLRVLAAGLAVVVLLTFLAYRFVYTPIHAQGLYRQGYRDVQSDRYGAGNRKFQEAGELWRMKPWYYRYAGAFVDKRQYLLATEKYDQLLSHWPRDEKGILDYAGLESEALANYEKADRLLDRLLDQEMYHYEALLASGDNFLRWAEDDPAQYEGARMAYATLLQRYGQQDEILFRMLRYFIRVDNFGEVERLKAYFQSTPEEPVNPDVYAELGGYLIDKSSFHDVQDVLFRALEEDESLPEVHYHLARYFREIGEHREEEKALNNARTFLEQTAPLSSERLAKLIDTHTRLGEVYFRKEEFISAEQELETAIRRYEDATERAILGKAERFGRAYARLGDIYYYRSGEFDAALDLYQEAEANLFREPSLQYKKGWIRYLNEDYEAALLDFYRAGDSLSSNKNTMYATANTLFRRGHYFAAQGYYNHLLSMYEEEMRAIPFLRPIEDEEHHALVTNMMKVYNNLGVTLRRLYERNADDERKASQGLVYLTYSSDYYDNLTRDPDTMDRTQTVNLAFLNTREVLYPQPDFDLQIYTNIPKDPDELEF